MSQPDGQGKDRFQYALNLTLAGVAGQVGCLTLLVVFAALFVGLWLDKSLGTKPVFTVVLLLGSVPVTLFLMFRMVKAAVDRMKPIDKKTPEEESYRGKDS